MCTGSDPAVQQTHLLGDLVASFTFLSLCDKTLAAYLLIISSLKHNLIMFTDRSILSSNQFLYIHLLRARNVQRNIFLYLKKSQSIAVYITAFLLPKCSIWS